MRPVVSGDAGDRRKARSCGKRLSEKSGRTGLMIRIEKVVPDLAVAALARKV